MSADKKWAIVTGGSRGLGFETAKGLIAAGISVYIIGKDQDRAAESAKKPLMSQIVKSFAKF